MIRPDEVRSALDAYEPKDMPALPGRTNHLATGVLVPLIWHEDRLECVATLRASSLRQHAGEVCFPGGRPDPTDDDLVATALREAHEELGIEGADVLGPLSSIPLYTSDYRLRPWVAAVPPQDLNPNPAEVAQILRLDVRTELARESVDAIPWTHPVSGITHLSPVFEIDERLMFGATAHTFMELLLILAPLFGVEAPERLPGKYDWSDVLPDVP